MIRCLRGFGCPWGANSQSKTKIITLTRQNIARKRIEHMACSRAHLTRSCSAGGLRWCYAENASLFCTVARLLLCRYVAHVHVCVCACLVLPGGDGGLWNGVRRRQADTNAGGACAIRWLAGTKLLFPCIVVLHTAWLFF